MDTMKLLLGATVALLLGALAVSWQGMKDGVKNAPSEEIARLKKQIDELRLEQDKLQREKQLQQLRSMPEPETSPSAAEIEAMKAQLEANNAALAALEAEKQADLDAKLAQDEEGLLSQRDLEKGDTELKRARMIAQALLIGRGQLKVSDVTPEGGIANPMPGFGPVQPEAGDELILPPQY